MWQPKLKNVWSRFSIFDEIHNFLLRKLKKSAFFGGFLSKNLFISSKNEKPLHTFLNLGYHMHFKLKISKNGRPCGKLFAIKVRETWKIQSHFLTSKYSFYAKFLIHRCSSWSEENFFLKSCQIWLRFIRFMWFFEKRVFWKIRQFRISEIFSTTAGKFSALTEVLFEA